MPHIVLVTSSYPDGIPGAEAAGSFVADFARELSTHVRVTVLAASSADSVITEYNLTVRRFSVPRTPLSLLKPLNPLDWISIIRTLQSGHAALESIIARDRPDHILALWVIPGGYWADTVARKYNVSYSTWALGSDIWSLGKIPLVRAKLRNILRRADYRFADGLQLATDVESLCGLSCHFLASARQLPRKKRKPLAESAPYKLAFLGRWHFNKGIDLLLDALLRLNDQDWQKISEIRIYGGGPLDNQVRLAVQQLCECGRPVILGGYLGEKSAADLIHWCDFLLLPSRIESIPVIYSDAMRLDTPVIATPVGDLPRLFDEHRFGILATELDSLAYAEAIRSALSDNAGRFRLAIDEAKADFDLKIITRRFVKRIGLVTA